MFAEYNATWDELESRLRTTNLKGRLYNEVDSYSYNIINP